MIRAGTAPKENELPQGFSEGAHRVVPVATYLGVRGFALKVLGQRFEPSGQCFGAGDDFRIRPRRRGGLGLGVDQLVGENNEANRNCRDSDMCRAPTALRGSCRRPAARRCANFPLRLRGKRPDRCARRSSGRSSPPSDRCLANQLGRVRPRHRGPWREAPRPGRPAARDWQLRPQYAEAPARHGRVFGKGRSPWLLRYSILDGGGKVWWRQSNHCICSAI